MESLMIGITGAIGLFVSLYSIVYHCRSIYRLQRIKNTNCLYNKFVKPDAFMKVNHHNIELSEAESKIEFVNYIEGIDLLTKRL